MTAAGALGKSFYKGGFEPKMNRREAALILHLKYARFLKRGALGEGEKDLLLTHDLQRSDVDEGEDTKESSSPYATQSS